MSITYKDADGIQGMRTAGQLAAEVLDHLTPHIVPGITTREIDRLAAEYMKLQGTTSATLGYQPPGYPPYPASLCTSVNHVVCHGIPNDKSLKSGDIVTKFKDQAVRTAQQLRNAVAATKPNTKTQLMLHRDGQPIEPRCRPRPW